MKKNQKLINFLKLHKNSQKLLIFFSKNFSWIPSKKKFQKYIRKIFHRLHVSRAHFRKAKKKILINNPWLIAWNAIHEWNFLIFFYKKYSNSFEFDCIALALFWYSNVSFLTVSRALFFASQNFLSNSNRGRKSENDCHYWSLDWSRDKEKFSFEAITFSDF